VGLPPCYFHHRSPPLGADLGNDNYATWFWAWGKGSQTLMVNVNDLKHRIHIVRLQDGSEWNAKNCLRS